MDYVIRNHKGVYIRLNQNGNPVTCSESCKSLFEFSKANNILDNLPRTLKRLKFKIEAIPDDIVPKDDSNKEKIIEADYEIPESIMRWVEKFGICDDILKEAQKRRDELNTELSNVDRQFVNLVHEIEFEGKVDLYGGWIERNRIKENREKRRRIKDELLIISSVLKMDFRNLDRETVNKAVAGLAKRKFKYRIVEEEEDNVV